MQSTCTVPSRSSSVTIAYGLPFFLEIPCCTAAIMPPRRVRVRLCNWARVRSEHLHGALEVLECHHRVRLAVLLGDTVLHGGNHASEAGEGPALQLGQGPGVGQ